MRDGETRRSIGLALPGIAWLVLFFLLPLLFVLIASFLSRGGGGLPVPPATLSHYERTFDVFGVVIWRTVWFALFTTLICLVIGYPVAFFIARRRPERPPGRPSRRQGVSRSASSPGSPRRSAKPSYR